MNKRAFLKRNFGIEIEMTGITRVRAAEVVKEHFEGTLSRTYGQNDTHEIRTRDGRVWKITYDGSIRTQRRVAGRRTPAGKEYSVELVSPILTYDEDIESLQELIRKLRKARAFSTKDNCTGIHIHLDGADHTPRSLKNFVNIIHARNDLLYDSLQIERTRMYYCKKMDEKLVEKIKAQKPTTFKGIEDIWYEDYRGPRTRKYHDSRYSFANLHSFFNGVGTVELRGFNNPNLHAGKIRSYIVLALAMNHQALTQKNASSKKPQVENPKFAMRTWLNRIGLIGEEFKNCREHLVKHLEGSAAWRFRRAA
ncbi:amidoligase family protein [Proteinivorax tanatarense]|uniref:Amidoligase family protein n=1 Tax=Proteinivorax tanatarense TaxID=1260629 RepID=A0AAU7VK96_9FIRM